MQLDIFVNYRGTCEEAFRFYEAHLGGQLKALLRHGDQPNPALPPGWRDKIVHARIEIAGTVLIGADIPHTEPMRSAYLSLALDSEEDAERIYGLLADGGEIFMAMEEKPFANRFAMLRDRFGTSWMLLHQSDSDGAGAASPA
jgi:PhnB protein